MNYYYHSYYQLLQILLTIFFTLLTITNTQVYASPQIDTGYAVPINKCCERFEVIQDGKCTIAKTIDNETETWQPIFTSEHGEMNINVPRFKFIIGLPACGGMQLWPVYQYPTVRLLNR